MTTQQHSTDLDTQVRTIKDRLAAAQRARVRAEAERDSATAAVEAAHAQLKTEFGVDTVDDAKARLAALEHELAAETAALAAELDQMGV